MSLLQRLPGKSTAKKSSMHCIEKDHTVIARRPNLSNNKTANKPPGNSMKPDKK